MLWHPAVHPHPGTNHGRSGGIFELQNPGMQRVERGWLLLAHQAAEKTPIARTPLRRKIEIVRYVREMDSGPWSLNSIGL